MIFATGRRSQCASPSLVRPFEHILDTVRTRNPGTAATLGTDIFAYFAEHPQQAAAFDAAMSKRTEAFAPSVAELCHFSDVRTVVGGQERTNAEYGVRLAAAGLHLTEVRPVAFPYGVLEDFSGITDAPA